MYSKRHVESSCELGDLRLIEVVAMWDDGELELMLAFVLMWVYFNKSSARG